MKLSYLTAARFFAAFGVFCFHLIPRWNPSFDQDVPELFLHLVRTGYIFVPFFFVLSGFVLEHTYSRQLSVGWGEFLVKRFARIVPAFWIGLALGAVPAWMALARTGEGAKIWGYLAVHLGFLGSWFPDAGIVNYPAWSIHAEMFFYLLFPFFLRLRVGSSLRGALIGLAFSLGIGWLIQGATFWVEPAAMMWNGLNQNKPDSLGWWSDFVQTHPIAHLPEFVMGIFLARLFRAWENPRLSWLIGSIGLGGVFWGIAAAPELPYLWLNGILLAPFFAALILVLAFLPGRAPPWLELLGEASYALYILHVPLRDWASAIRSKNTVDPILFTIVVMGLILGVSVLVYRWIEIPARRAILRRLSS